MKKKFTKTPIQAATVGWFTYAQLIETLGDTFSDDVYDAVSGVVERKLLDLSERLSEGIDSAEVLQDYCVSSWVNYLKAIAKFEGASFSENIALAVFRKASVELLRNLLSEAIRETSSPVLYSTTADGASVGELIFE